MADSKFDPASKQWVPDDTRLSFEKRILNPSGYPTLDNKDGTYSTHSMAWDGKYIAYPTVIQQGNKLVRLTPDQAYVHALETKEFREFTTPDDAEAYSNGGYKNSWGRLEAKIK